MKYDPNKFVTAAEAAKRLGISRNAFPDLANQCSLRRIKLGKRILYRWGALLEDIDAYAENYPDEISFADNLGAS